MKKMILALIFVSASSVLPAQNLTPAQKTADFRYLTSLYATYYSSIDWKKQDIGFDVLAIQPWIDKVAKTTTDLDFYEVCVEYVANLRDSHDHFSLTSDFLATLGFTTDIYDGVLLIDSLNRAQLSASKYPFAIGDQLVSIDSVDALQLVETYRKYSVYANPTADRRVAAQRITNRPQSRMPHASDVNGQSATVVIKRQNGNLETYTIPWVSTGTPLEVGPVPSPKISLAPRAAQLPDSGEPDYMKTLLEAQWSGELHPEDLELTGFGSRSPVFLSALSRFAFTRRLGSSSADFFYSGFFKYEELTIGYIRIPNYAPDSTTAQLQVFQKEIAWMNANTDGLIVDEMRNNGGSGCFGENIVSLLIPNQFTATGLQYRPFWTRILSFYNSMISAKAANAPTNIVEQYELMYNAMLAANQQGKLLTGTLPICTSSLTRPVVTDANGNPVAYIKPLMLLVDEFSASAADSVAAMLKDSGRAVLFGMRTNGAGGNNTSYDAGTYSEGLTGMTLGLLVRPKITGGDPGFPYTDYIENVGISPDIPVDYMTKDNLLQSGVPFVGSFLQHMAAEIRAKK